MNEEKPLFLELFSGSGQIGEFAKVKGFRVESVDNIDRKEKGSPSILMDFMDFDIREFCQEYGVPSVIWASPPCTTYSIATGKHRNKEGKPKTEEAFKADAMLEKLKIDIAYVQWKGAKVEERPKDVIFWIENPRGRMQNLGMKGLEAFKNTVTYCQYGDSRMKPTNIWTNCEFFRPLEMCKRGSGCHESARRGEYGGTNKISGAYERSKIPRLLQQAVIEASILHIHARD